MILCWADKHETELNRFGGLLAGLGRPSDRLGARGRPSGRRRFRMMIL
ncbi:MAG: hypothetical protein LBO05_12320 [Deltaproteobacteria bacterium]|jgi:hypothetical protein|nr:hypothetical protein [Deltaproteobacteria bacterium]